MLSLSKKNQSEKCNTFVSKMFPDIIIITITNFTLSSIIFEESCYSYFRKPSKVNCISEIFYWFS